ncbi:MAG: DUF2520 domain-containing protein [Flavitalea sp.]
MRIVIIGSGNVATVLGRKMILAHHEVIQVVSRSEDHAAQLAKELKSTHTTDINRIDTNAQLYLLSISDSALYHAHDWLKVKKQIVVHTAGSVPMDILKLTSENYGVLYPLQSLRKEIKKIPEIPFLIDGNTDDTKSQIASFAKSLSPNTHFANDAQRGKLHIGSVITNNFSNHLYALAQDFCANEKVDFNLLLPLINELGKRLTLGPAMNFQTGPAVRNDQVTINHHLALLKNYPQLLKLYSVFSESIIETHSKK